MKTMLRLVLLFFITIHAEPLWAQNTIQSPTDFLGYELGSQYTLHHKVVDYVEHVADQSDRVTLYTYGSTYEGRSLHYLIVTSSENLTRLEQIRENNLRRTGLLQGEPVENQPAIIWLSYNIHGNETSSSEAAMKTLYTLAHSTNDAIVRQLQNSVVIIDPMLNPDGRDRYVNWYKQARGAQPNANPLVREHQEPWPGGRVNHYLFDLNRDWAWQTQKETRQRIAVYNSWMPQIHVDFHEQGKDDHYYFAPAAQPFHTAITQWQSDFQTTIGKNHTTYFNDKGWLYFTRDIFDLFYPSYGDTWPTFNGSIGMTYEQAGHSMGGLAVKTNDLDTLTLKERIEHHFTTGLSTIEITAKNRQAVLQNFTQYFQQTISNGSGQYGSFIIKGDNDKDKIRRLLNYLDDQQIRYGRANEPDTYDGFNYLENREQEFSVESNDIVIRTRQPKGVLARVLFEPNPHLTDSLTYDITAWSTPYAYGLEAYALEDDIETNPFSASEMAEDVTNMVDEDAYAYLAEWHTTEDVQFLAELLKQNVKVRASEVPFTINGKSYDRGTLIITRLGNELHLNNLQQIATKFKRNIIPVSTGYVESGGDFGSGSIRFLRKPNVAVLAGEHISANRFGEVWHFFDQQISYPLDIIKTSTFDDIEFHAYDVLILPSGNYEAFLQTEDVDRLKKWVQEGGKLVVLQAANQFFVGKESFDIEKKETESEKSSPEQKTFALRNRKAISRMNAGSIFKVSLDNTHPLGFGYDSTYYTLKTGTQSYSLLSKGWNVGVLKEQPLVSGFAGHEVRKNLANSAVFGVQPMGGGEVIYLADNPLFRAFWHNGKLLFANAVFMVGK